MSDTFADPRSRLYANRLGRNVHFADDMNDTGSGHKVDIARDSHAEKQNGNSLKYFTGTLYWCRCYIVHDFLDLPRWP